jgi:hypothetical protein
MPYFSIEMEAERDEGDIIGVDTYSVTHSLETFLYLPHTYFIEHIPDFARATNIKRTQERLPRTQRTTQLLTKYRLPNLLFSREQHIIP